MIKHLVISLTRFSMVLALQTADIVHHASSAHLSQVFDYIAAGFPWLEGLGG